MINESYPDGQGGTINTGFRLEVDFDTPTIMADPNNAKKYVLYVLEQAVQQIKAKQSLNQNDKQDFNDAAGAWYGQWLIS